MTSNKEWYILRTRANMEKKAQTLLCERIARLNIAHLFGEILVPEEKVVEVKNGKRKETMRKLYTGYIFLEIDFTDEVWHAIKDTLYILGFVGGDNRRPSPVPKSEMERIFSLIKETEAVPIQKHQFEVGEALLITNGPFKDFNARVQQVNYDRETMKVSVTIFGRETMLDLNISDVTKIF